MSRLLLPLGTLALALSLLSAPPASADEGFAFEGDAGYQDLTQARKSAEAVFSGASGGFVWGGGLRYVFRKGIFLTGVFRDFNKTGQRVFVADATSPVFPLGTPLAVRMHTYQGTIGYRFSTKKAFTPYLGIGAGVNKYHEQSTVGGVTDTVDESKPCYHALAGIELGHGILRIAAEGGYTLIPNSIGVGGVSRIYGETGIGGFWGVGKLVLTSGQ